VTDAVRRVAVLGLFIATFTARVPAAAVDGRDIYLDKCATCHGPDGAGKNVRGKKLKVKDVRETSKTVTAAQMADIVKKGKEPDMFGYAKALSDEQIQAVVDYYRGLARAEGAAK
jgi:mono/diheme cytochrome c family protein